MGDCGSLAWSRRPRGTIAKVGISLPETAMPNTERRLLTPVVIWSSVLGTLCALVLRVKVHVRCDRLENVTLGEFAPAFDLRPPPEA